MQAVTLAEVFDFFFSIRADVLAEPTPGERAVEAFSRGIVACRRSPLMAAILKFEPDTMNSLATPDNSGWMQALRAAVASALVGPEYPRDAALRAAELMLRITISLIVAPTKYLPTETESQAQWFARAGRLPGRVSERESHHRMLRASKVSGSGRVVGGENSAGDHGDGGAYSRVGAFAVLSESGVGGRHSDGDGQDCRGGRGRVEVGA